MKIVHTQSIVDYAHTLHCHTTPQPTLYTIATLSIALALCATLGKKLFLND